MSTANPAGSTINVMIVDDSLTVRTVFARMIDSDPALKIAAKANSAEAALQLLEAQDIDVILLDLEMPGMGGLDALPKMLETHRGVQVLVVSSLAQKGAEHTLAALANGAADTMLKPRSGGFDEAYKTLLLEKIKALGGIDGEPSDETNARKKNQKSALARRGSQLSKRPKIVAFGASTGGIHALNLILKALPAKMALPIAITQHLPTNFIATFAHQIESVSGRKTRVAEEGTIVSPGEILIATGEGHMEFVQAGDQTYTKVSSEAVPSNCLPSVDPMLTSLTRVYDGHVLGVILSGMGRDGLEGAKDLVLSGGSLLVQDAQTSAVWGMPGAIANAGLADKCLPPLELAAAIANCAGAAAWR
jgi:two-component system chemotaxis response regulator CheB